MKKIALKLRTLSDNDRIAKVRQIAASMVANPTIFGTSEPDAAALTAAADAVESAVTAQKVAAQAAEAATTAKEEAMEDMIDEAMKAASWADSNIPEPEKREKAYTLEKDREATTEIAQVEDLSAMFGKKAKEIILEWDPVLKAKSYEVQMRIGTGPWTHVKSTTRSKVTIPNLDSGTEHEFQVRAIGPNELEGPWSDPATRRAP